MGHAAAGGDPRRDPRRELARQQFAPTPIASDFEIRFARQFYAFVDGGGSPDVESFPARLRRRRLVRWLVIAGVAATALSFVIYPSMSSVGPSADWSSNAVASWIAAALLLTIPFTIVIVVSQVRLARDVAQMRRDRSRYVEYRRQAQVEDEETSRRLRDLGIDL
jgi:hypothetical protein